MARCRTHAAQNNHAGRPSLADNDLKGEASVNSADREQGERPDYRHRSGD